MIIPRKSVLDLFDRAEHSEEFEAATLAKTYKKEIKTILGEECFPSNPNWGTPLRAIDLVLYVKTRPDTPRLEHKLHDLLCPCSGRQENNKKIIELLADEGVGKSTLLRYVFDYYLEDTMNQWNNPQEHARFLNEKCILYIDLMTQISMDRIYNKQKAGIKETFLDIDREAHFAMWDHLMEWNHSDHKEAQGNDDLDKYRHQCVISKNYDARTWVKEAVRYLSTVRMKQVIIIWDNIDQTPPDLQQEVVDELIAWAQEVSDDNNNRVRFIFSIRPETVKKPAYTRRMPANDRLIAHFPVGKVVENEMFGKRGHEIKKPITESTRLVSLRVRNPQDVLISIPVYKSHSAKCIEELLSDLTSVVPRTTNDMLTKFCRGSNRRYLRLAVRLLTSAAGGEILTKIAQSEEGGTKTAFKDYKFLDGIICGEKDWHDDSPTEFSPVCDIYNLYRIAETPLQENEFSVWCGPYLLRYLKDYPKENITYEELERHFTVIGFKPCEIWNSIEMFMQLKIIKINTDQIQEKTRIYPESEIITGLWQIFLEAAYTDNMAMVTRVSMGTDERKTERDYRAKVKMTSGIRSRDFYNRIMTTLAFLEQIKADEKIINCDPIQPSDKTHPADSRERDKNNAKAKLIELGLLGLHHTTPFEDVLNSYVNRLQKLWRNRREDKIDTPSITVGQWKTIMSQQIIKQKCDKQLAEIEAIIKTEKKV